MASNFFKINKGLSLVGQPSAPSGAVDGDVYYDTTLNKWQFRQNGAWVDLGAGGGGSGGSGSSSGTDLFSVLELDEVNKLISLEPNIFDDDFGDEEKGTKVNVHQSVSALFLDPGQTSGTYERTCESTTPFTQIEGLAVASLKTLAPKNTALTPSSLASSVTMIFQGDLTDLLAATKFVLVCKEVIADGKLRQIFVTKTDGTIARLSISGSPTYNSGTDETTVVISNPDLLVLDFGLSPSNYNSTLRVKLFDHKFEAKLATAGAYEQLSIDDAHIYDPPTVRLPGENFSSVVAGTITGAVLKSAFERSDNGQYGLGIVLEKTAGNSVWHFFRSVDNLNTWTEFATTASSNASESEELGGTFGLGSRTNLFVANNGIGFMLYLYHDPSNGKQARAYYTDLSVGSPTLTACASTGAGAGIVDPSVSGTYELREMVVSGDKVDGSFIAVATTRSNAVGGLYFFTSGGAVFQNATTVSTSVPDTHPLALHVSGSGSAHRTHLIHHVSGVGRLDYHYYDQPAAAEVGTIIVVPTGSGDHAPIDSVLVGNQLTLLYYAYNQGVIGFVTGNISGTPSFGSPNILSALPTETYVGWTSTTNRDSFFKTLRQSIAVNPSSANHMIIVRDQTHADGQGRATMFEIADVTNYLGIQISNYNVNTSQPVKNNASSQQISQTFTVTGSTTIKTVSARALQVGRLPAGTQLTCEIQQTTASKPNGTVVATALNSIDASMLTKNASGQDMYFNFVPVTPASGLYALVFKLSHAIDSSNYVSFRVTTTDTYAGGINYVFDGSTWNPNTGDMVFEINGDWVTDIGQALDAGVSPFGVKIDDQETSIAVSGSSTAQILSRRVVVGLDAVRPLTGMTYRRVLSFSSSPSLVQSTITGASPFGYAPGNYDANMVFNIRLGDTQCGQKNVITGVVDTTKLDQDRSGFNHKSENIGQTVTYTSDPDFDGGVCGVFAGTGTDYLQWDNTTVDSSLGDMLNINANIPFAIRLQYKQGSPSDGTLFAYATPSTATYYELAIHSGFLSFRLVSGGSPIVTVQANDAAEVTTAHWVMFTWDGATPKLWRSADGINFTQVASYSLQQSITTFNLSGSVIYVGGEPSIPSPFIGKIGTVQYVKGSSSFNYSLFKPQPPITDVCNLGTRGMNLQRAGTNSQAANSTDFAQVIAVSGSVNSAAVIDSYDTFLKFKKSSFATAGREMFLKLTMSRVSDRDQSAFQGLIFKYNK